MKNALAVLAITAGIFVVSMLSAPDCPGAEKNFVVSFGTGGLTAYRVVDNTCFVYTLGYPKEESQISPMMNDVLTDSINKARKQFAKDNDGLVNIKVAWQFLGKDRIIYQVCGDVVKKGGK